MRRHWVQNKQCVYAGCCPASLVLLNMHWACVFLYCVCVFQTVHRCSLIMSMIVMCVITNQIKQSYSVSNKYSFVPSGPLCSYVSPLTSAVSLLFLEWAAKLICFTDLPIKWRKSQRCINWNSVDSTSCFGLRNHQPCWVWRVISHRENCQEMRRCKQGRR